MLSFFHYNDYVLVLYVWDSGLCFLKWVFYYIEVCFIEVLFGRFYCGQAEEYIYSRSVRQCTSMKNKHFEFNFEHGSLNYEFFLYVQTIHTAQLHLNQGHPKQKSWRRTSRRIMEEFPTSFPSNQAVHHIINRSIIMIGNLSENSF